jgi:tRNA G18 (ribose-2'-O)-methylase SpoU
MKIAVLDNLRSVYNVGSIFRTANAVGIDKIYLCGTTPTPLDKKGHKRKDFAKVALGAEDTVEWEYAEETRSKIQELKNEGYYIIALEQAENSIDYKNVNIKNKKDPTSSEGSPSTHEATNGHSAGHSIAFIIGHEVDGITKDVIELSDVIAEIPMLGTKESLNVTIAFGIATYRILDV